MKEYYIVRMIKEEYWLNADSKEEALSDVAENGDPTKASIKSIKIKLVSNEKIKKNNSPRNGKH